jgi:hypothetical protein
MRGQMGHSDPPAFRHARAADGTSIAYARLGA